MTTASGVGSHSQPGSGVGSSGSQVSAAPGYAPTVSAPLAVQPLVGASMSPPVLGVYGQHGYTAPVAQVPYLTHVTLAGSVAPTQYSLQPPPFHSVNSQPYHLPVSAQLGAGYYQASEHEEADGSSKNNVPMKHNKYYNLNTMLASNILNSRYFRGLYEKTTFQQVIDEIYYKVDNVEPFLTQTGSASNAASTAFCLLYKLFTMTLTKKQLGNMLDHGDSPYIRCLGFLYLRYTCPPDQLWEYFKHYVDDEQEFPPSKNKKIVTMGQYIKNLLIEQKYYGTLFPRIPKLIETDIQVELLKNARRARGEEPVDVEEKADKESLSTSASNAGARSRDGFEIGDLVKARYSEDGKWYEAKIMKVAEDNSNTGGAWVVQYVDYGNEETVAEKHLKLIRNKEEDAQKKEKEDAELRKQVLERKRLRVTTSNKSDYARKISSFKKNISVPLDSREVSKELHIEHQRNGYRTVDDVLGQRGRLGHIEREDPEEQERKARKRRERQRDLERMYGNEAKKKRRFNNSRR